MYLLKKGYFERGVTKTSSCSQIMLVPSTTSSSPTNSMRRRQATTMYRSTSGRKRTFLTLLTTTTVVVVVALVSFIEARSASSSSSWKVNPTTWQTPSTSKSRRTLSTRSSTSSPILGLAQVIPRGGSEYYNNRNPLSQQGPEGIHPPPPTTTTTIDESSSAMYWNDPAFNDPLASPEPPSHDPRYGSVQEQVEHWRNLQREQAAAQVHSPRDTQGRIKLMTSVSKGSRALIFFVLMWRNVHLYEMADQSARGLLRTILVFPLVLLFMANLAGVVASITSPSHSAKKRLKAILNLDKFMEVLLIMYAFVRLTVWPSKTVMREQYIASVLHSVFFILQCQAFTKLSWDETSMPTMQSYMSSQGEEYEEEGSEAWAHQRSSHQHDIRDF